MRDGWRECKGVGGISLANSTPAQQYDGANAAGQQTALDIIDMAQAFSIGKAAYHNGKRLVAAALATAQLDHRLLIGGVAGQMESAQALDGDNTAAGQQLDTAVNNGIAGFARAADGRRRSRALELHVARRLAPRNVRPAVKAGIGLRVKAPVKRVAILCGALGAHGKAIHRRGRSVIRQRPDDGKARPAVGAVDKGVVIASVGGVEQLAQAVVTGGDIGGDERRVHGLILRRYDTKGLLIVGIPSVGLQVCNSDMLNAGRGRRVLRQRGDKFVERLTQSMRLDVHAIARVEHPAANAMRHSLAIHKWPHANALHNARYMDMHMSHAILLR